MNEKVDITIFKRNLTVEMEGFTPMEINAIAQRVTDKMTEMAEQNPKVADSSKLAILASLHLAAELYQNTQARDTDTRALEHKIEELSLVLQSALSAQKR